MIRTLSAGDAILVGNEAVLCDYLRLRFGCRQPVALLTQHGFEDAPFLWIGFISQKFLEARNIALSDEFFHGSRSPWWLTKINDPAASNTVPYIRSIWSASDPGDST